MILLNLALAQEIDPEMVKAINTSAAVHDIPQIELYKLAFVEGSLKPRPKTNYNSNGTQDVGPFQINTINWNFCKEYDLQSVLGNTLCAGKLLKMHQKSGKKNWVLRYHSKNPKYQAIYKEKLDKAEQHLNSITKYNFVLAD